MLSPPLWGLGSLWAVAGGQELRAPAPTRGRCGVEAREFPRLGVRASGPGELSGGPQPTGRPPFPPPGPPWLRAHATAQGPCFSGSAPSRSFLGSELGRKCRSLGIWSPAFVVAAVTPVFIALPGLSLAAPAGLPSLWCRDFPWQSTGSRPGGFRSVGTQARELRCRAYLLRSVWNLPRGQTRIPCTGRQILTHCTTGGSPSFYQGLKRLSSSSSAT